MSTKPDSNSQFLDVVIYTTEDPAKTYHVVQQLLDGLSSEVQVLILHAEPPARSLEDFGPHVRFQYLPGESAISLRGQMPAYTGQAEWITVLEDHVHVDSNWLQCLIGELKKLPDDVTCLIGAACNLTSLEPWSWANFLNVQAFHWAPRIVEPVQPLGFNITYRRALLPDSALRPGEFEVVCPAIFMRNPRASIEFPANHVQQRFLPDVLYYHFCNGRVSGAAIRDYHSGGRIHAIRHALRNCGRRRKMVDRIIRNHPLFPELPSGTRWRVGVLAWCHTLGALAGCITGPGRAAWALE